jgi:hypothetical protein
MPKWLKLLVTAWPILSISGMIGTFSNQPGSYVGQVWATWTLVILFGPPIAWVFFYVLTVGLKQWWEWINEDD